MSIEFLFIMASGQIDSLLLEDKISLLMEFKQYYKDFTDDKEQKPAKETFNNISNTVPSSQLIFKLFKMNINLFILSFMPIF